MRGCARSVDGARPSNVTKKNQRSADGQAPQCNEEAGRGRRLGAEKILRPLVGLTKRSVEAVTKKKAKKHRSYHCPSRREVADQIPRDLGEMGAKAKTSKKDWKWQRGVTSHPVSEGHWKKSHLTVWRWESEKAQKVGAFQLMVFGTMSPPMALRWESQAGWGACGWSITTRSCGLPVPPQES